jgi:hypothetical protein
VGFALVQGGNVFGDSEFEHDLKTDQIKAKHAHGMEDAVVDLVVIQWIVQKLKRDLRSKGYSYTHFTRRDSDEAQSA